MKPGTILKVKYNQNMSVPVGTMAVVVDKSEYPDLYQELQDNMKKLDTLDSIDEFIAVEWPGEASKKQKNGFYLSSRFDEVKVQAKA